MSIIVFSASCVLAAGLLILWRARVFVWALFAVLVTLAIKLGALTGDIIAPPQLSDIIGWWPGWLPAAILLALSLKPLRRVLLASPAYHRLKGIMPKLSSTEQEALEAGTVGFDAELFSGTPDWKMLRAIPPI
ncbi:MAG: acyl-CoA dehydrogenase, partial [Alphaproteobacteria bacterium]